MLSHHIWSRFRISLIAIDAPTIILISAAGSNAAVFLPVIKTDEEFIVTM
ncbi:MAG: hypothetical protein IPI64_10455 [Chloracidobacterium sp.]|nr:hypothetical protein [Chloracidobacterium sp.]